MIPAASRGTTTISERAVAKIAQQAAREREAGARGRVRGDARVRGRRAEVSVRLALPWPADLGAQAGVVQEHVRLRTGELTGLHIRSPRLRVTSLSPGGESVVPSPVEEAGHKGVPPRRWWSARRVPAALTALTACGLAGWLTADIVAVRVSGHEVAPWRAGVAEQLSAVQVSGASGAVLAVAAAFAGLWLLVLACTPGLRRRHVVDGFGGARSVALDRATVATSVRERALDGEGVDSVEVRVGRRTVRVRAALSFGDPAMARERMLSAVRTVLHDCSLHRPLRIRATVRTTDAWDRPRASAASADPTAVPSGEEGAR